MPLLSEDSLTADLPWAMIGVVLVAALLGLVWLVLAQLRALEQRLAKLDRLEDLRTLLARLVESGAGLDLRRIEHVLIDLRDAQRRLEPRLLDLAEKGGARAAVEPGEGGRPAGAAPLAERAVNRLLALGYERVQVVSGPAELAELDQSDGDGEIRVEARRDGAVHKGRVLVRGGAVTGAELRSVHSMFP